MFTLDPRLQADTFTLGQFSLSRLLLMNDRTYPWLILVPQRAGIREIHELAVNDRRQLIEESCHLAETLAALYHPDKLNVAALGNIVPQLHVHHVVRYRSDPAWPAPVWGKTPPVPYGPEELAACRDRLTPLLAGFSPAADG